MVFPSKAEARLWIRRLPDGEYRAYAKSAVCEERDGTGRIEICLPHEGKQELTRSWYLGKLGTWADR